MMKRLLSFILIFLLPVFLGAQRVLTPRGFEEFTNEHQYWLSVNKIKNISLDRSDSERYVLTESYTFYEGGQVKTQVEGVKMMEPLASNLDTSIIGIVPEVDTSLYKITYRYPKKCEDSSENCWIIISYGIDRFGDTLSEERMIKQLGFNYYHRYPSYSRLYSLRGDLIEQTFFNNNYGLLDTAKYRSFFRKDNYVNSYSWTRKSTKMNNDARNLQMIQSRDSVYPPIKLIDTMDLETYSKWKYRPFEPSKNLYKLLEGYRAIVYRDEFRPLEVIFMKQTSPIIREEYNFGYNCITTGYKIIEYSDSGRIEKTYSYDDETYTTKKIVEWIQYDKRGRMLLRYYTQFIGGSDKLDFISQKFDNNHWFKDLYHYSNGRESGYTHYIQKKPFKKPRIIEDPTAIKYAFEEEYEYSNSKNIYFVNEEKTKIEIVDGNSKLVFNVEAWYK